MKRISFLTILILISGIFISCNTSSSDDSVTKGYNDPGLDTEKDINKYKAYTLSNSDFGTCSDTTNGTCNAVIYQGKLSGSEYVGIGVQKGLKNLKIYWVAATIPEGLQTINTCSVSLNGTTNHNVSISFEITNNDTVGLANGTYNIVFKNPIPAELVGIVADNSITAVKI